MGLARKEGKSKGLELDYDTIMQVMRSMGVPKSQAYDSRRAAQVILEMREDKDIWRVFTRDYLHRTAIYKLYALHEPLKTYQSSGKTEVDKKKFLDVVEKVHTLPRDVWHLKSGKGTRFVIRSFVKEIRDKEIVVEVTDDLSDIKGRDTIIGSKAKVTIISKEER